MRPLLLGAVLLAAVTATFVWITSRPETTWKRIQRTATIRVGYSHEAPYAYRTASGEVTGIDPELARAVLQRAGIGRIEWVQTEFRSLIPELQAGRFDMIASAIAVTPERERLIAFSRPTIEHRPALLVRVSDTARYGALRDLHGDSAARVAILEGAMEERMLLAAGVSARRIYKVPDVTTGVQAIRAGRAAAFMLTTPTVRTLAESTAGELAVVPLAEHDPALGSAGAGHSAFGFRPEDGALRAAVDDVLREFIGSPEHAAIAARFGFAPTALPAP